MNNKWNIFSLLYIIVWAVLLTIELLGVFTHYRPIDTMSQWVWLWREKMPWTSLVVITLFLGWLWWHFNIYKGRVMD